ncbi:hypothetical protein DY120_06360 [Apilactobacillus micheneri]|uniref:Uncharacterized protein n=1 Tax=Apilactobacillus micheneri TaxID=1899430 RepID=A0ABY2YW33_9LACO|nr:hypothetical protein [Apilactobacillus micheneri]TPR24273.1 hypothetical protein DY114_06360 [Apilactobacillus micheneri]TPR25292.1 hypothetical protein DY111_06360 [Apilactobacillus micheneri]TPR27604.1 hypothetical protein DY113_05460 [Apilactobacillus micheneri]TPR28869.1 hypothetical protein DY117_06360 [Apilactobacillus micheneri]TPR29891.1 hypothetical protein DY120_06360 [Apilactobacillus micheneri]
MNSFTKEMLLNLGLLVFPFIFIISGISDSSPVLYIGIMLLGIICILMAPIYVYYWFNNSKGLWYRKTLAIVYIVVLLACINSYIF